MKIKERLEAFWAGEKPDRIPFTIYTGWEHTGDPAWHDMFKAGLGVTHHVAITENKISDVEFTTNSFVDNGKNIVRNTMKTPVGEIYTQSTDGWTQKHWIKTAEDYKIMTYIINNMSMVPAYDKYSLKEKEIYPYGIPLVFLGRTPLQEILVDYVGLENFAFHLFDCEEELMELYHALLKKFEERVEITASGPGKFVSVLENFTAETMGPERFEKYHIPVYKKLFPMLKQAGKVVGTHYDGKLRSCSKLIAEAPIDVIESLTPPPEGDMTLGECRKIWPDKLFWSNINVSNYYLPRRELKDLVYDLVKQGSSDGRLLAFEISEQNPDNWKQSIPIVLEALNEISI